MALPDVSIQIQGGGLGRVAPSDDRVVGLILSGEGYTLPLLTPKQLFSADELVGLVPTTEPYGVEIHRQVQDFFRAAGDGAELWLMLVFAETVVADIFTAGYATTLMQAAGGRLAVVGIGRLLIGETPTVTEGIHPDVLAGMDEAHAWAEAQAAAHQPCRVLLDGKFLDPNLAGLRNLKGHSFNSVGICVGSVRPGRTAAMGLLLGRVAATPVHISLGRVKDGSVPTSTALLTSGIPVVNATAVGLHQKGYIFLRKLPNKEGYYWVGGHMACPDTDDFYDLSFGRVIDKASRIAYRTFAEELLDSVLVDTRTGRLAKTTIKNYQARIEQAIGLGMAAKGEISGVSCYIDPAQDILATSELRVGLRIVPTGLLNDIRVTLGFSNPAR